MLLKSKTALFTAAALPLAALIALPAPAGAQEEAWERDIETREIMVTATRTEKELMELPISVGVVNAEDIRREPAANVADALADMPGVAVTDGGMPGGKRVMIRGESPMRSLILIDGVKVSEQKSMSGSAILIDTSQIERVEVIKGPASVLYGSEAIGGVINIITKKGGDKPVGFSQNFIVDSSTESVDIQSAVFGAIGGFNYRFSASGLNAGDRKAPDGKIKNSSYKNRNYSGRVGYDWDNASVYLRADRYESDIHIPTNSSSGLAHVFGDFVPPAMSGFKMNNTVDVSLYLPKWDRQSISSGFELRDLTENLIRLKADIYFQNTKKDFFNNIHVANWTQTGFGQMKVVMDQNINAVNDQDSFGGSFQSEWQFGGHSIIAGLDYNKDDLKADDHRLGGSLDIYPPGASVPMVMPFDPVSYRYKVKQSTIGLFAQDEWSFADDWTATVGLRETWVDSEFKDNNNPDLTHRQKIRDSRLVASVGLVYCGFDDLSLRALWAQGYRFPSLNQLYLGTTHGQQGFVHPNPDLEPETSNNYELGARYQGVNWNLDLAAFFSDAKNYITYNKITGGDWKFENMDKAETFGVEMGLDYTFPECGLTPYLNAAWINRRVTNSVTTASVDPSLVPGPGAISYGRATYKTSNSGVAPFQGRVGLKWQKELEPARLVYTDLYVNWASKTKDYHYDGDYSLDFVTDHYAGWQTLNLTLGAEWGEEHKWNTSLSLRNIGDRAYTRAENRVEDPGFHVVLGVGFEY